ncbi:ATP-dependent RNA helicase dhx8 [Borealophlyctis nickersoniae]|nr:ATP-dependent RNA helicase dhx8 [Borealophlyctis nickersoniae]
MAQLAQTLFGAPAFQDMTMVEERTPDKKEIKIKQNVLRHIWEILNRHLCLIEESFSALGDDLGSGKTTQLPQYILESMSSVRSIAVTQPRRIAAISAARRVSDEMGTRLGEEVGYSIRFERVAGSRTKILYMTDGTLLRACTADPRLDAYDVVVLDEAHERSLETDVLFGLMRRACRLRPDLKLVVMSATLDIEKFSEYFGDCPVFSIPGRMYAVDIFWQKKMKFSTLKTTYMQRAVETVMHIHKNEEPGDVWLLTLRKCSLVFLTGQQEIEQAIRTLREAHAELDYREVRHSRHVRDIVAIACYSALETLEQRAIFDPPEEGLRKTVFATNIAQTSVTIPGIRYVVDSGFVKQKMYDAQSGMDALVVVPISQAAATQRAGRAGRTAAGKVYRLYSREAFEDMDPATIPEIQRSSLIGTVLNLKNMGIDDVLNFEFIDPPDPQLVMAAIRQLFCLEMLTIASMLSVEEIFSSPRSPKKRAAAEEARRRFDDSTGDHLTLLRVYEEWRENDYSRDWCFDNYIHHRAMRAAKNVRQQLMDLLEKLKLPIISCRVKARGKRRGSNGGGERDRKRSRRDSHGRSDPTVNDDIAVDPVPILRSLCTAFYVNTARRHPQRHFFFHYVTSAGLASTTGSSPGTAPSTTSGPSGTSSQMIALHIDPRSSLYESSAKLDWIIYNDVQYVNRATMRCVSRIDFSMVEVLMGRLKLVDDERLAGLHRPGAGSGRRASIVSLSDLVDRENGGGGEGGDGGKSDDDQRGGSAPASEDGKKLDFELVHEVIDEQRHVERTVGEEVGGRKAGKGGAELREESNADASASASASSSGMGGLSVGRRKESEDVESRAGVEDDEATQRAIKAAAARERYLKRKR